MTDPITVETTAETPEAFLAYQSKIAPELEAFRRPLSEFSIHPDNVRKHDIAKISQSLQSHGQRALIIVEKATGYIVKGNGTFTAMQLLGWEEGAFLEQEMTPEEALAFLYADNRASDLATYDRKKLRAGLAKMVEGPGLFDTLWTVEEFEDLDEEMRGATVLDPQETAAAFATPDGESVRATEGDKKVLPGERMREVPIVLSIADHAMFIERIQTLRKIYGTGGTIATVIEAVRRQSEAEGPVQTGRGLAEWDRHLVRRELVKEIRDFVTAFPPDRSFTATWLAAQLEKMEPYKQAPAEVAEGQTTIEETITEVTVETVVEVEEGERSTPQGVDPDEPEFAPTLPAEPEQS